MPEGRRRGLTGVVRFHVVAMALAMVAASVRCPQASAAPQASAGLTVGGGVRDLTGADGARGGFHMGGRADVLFFRSRGSDMALGPYVGIGTLSFDRLDVGGGVEWLVPVRDDLPVVVSVGGVARDTAGWPAGAEAAVFFGSRSHNFHSWYGLAAGVFAQAKWIPVSATTDVILGAQIDMALLALPWLLLYEAVAR